MVEALIVQAQQMILTTLAQVETVQQHKARVIQITVDIITLVLRERVVLQIILGRTEAVILQEALPHQIAGREVHHRQVHQVGAAVALQAVAELQEAHQVVEVAAVVEAAVGQDN